MRSAYELERGALGKSKWKIMSWSKLESLQRKAEMDWRYKIGDISIR